MTRYKHAEWLALLKERFGDDPANWAFRCPVCNDVATGADFTAALAAHPRKRTDGSVIMASDRLGQECIGRSLGALERPRTAKMEDSRKWGGRGCDWTTYGLFNGPDFVELDDGKEHPCFPIADQPITPTAAEAALLAYVDAVADELDPPNNDQPADGKSWPTHCWCGEPVQPSKALDHRCRQCAKHCEIAAHRAGRPSPRLGIS